MSLTEPVVQSAVESERSAPVSPTRLMCLDVFRGLMVAGMILVDNPGDDDRAYWPIQHAKWNGWHPADFIFPSFVFLVGISMVYSLNARLQRGESRRKIFLHVIQRSLLLIAIGLFVNGFPVFHLADLRIYGVTQRIALCYFAAAILVLWSGRRGQLAALAACLVGYWALLRFVPVPGLGVPGHNIPFMDPERNLAAWLDRKVLMGRLYDGVRDPEGLISTIPAIGTTLIGVLTGQGLRSHHAPKKKVLRMVTLGLLGVVAGLSWNTWFPINKNLWTSSFVLLSAGLGMLFLAFLYWVLEIKQWRGPWTLPVLVFGMNAIAGFIADALVYGPGYSFTAELADGKPVPWHQWANARILTFVANPPLASLVYSLGAVFFAWLLLWMLWRKRVFLKI